MRMHLSTERDHDELKVTIEGVFTIPYEGSAAWLDKLYEFIDAKSI